MCSNHCPSYLSIKANSIATQILEESNINFPIPLTLMIVGLYLSSLSILNFLKTLCNPN